MNKTRADDVRVAYPLFQVGSGGSIPTSALSLLFERCERCDFIKLNRMWHSRLPRIGGFYVDGMFYRACGSNDITYAVAGWSRPVAIAFNGKPVFELRRMAIADDAPKNTASRMLGWMARDIKKRCPNTSRLISYQDTAVHKGTIYKASGWVATRTSKAGEQNWCKTHKRKAREIVTDAVKVRWEREI